MRKQIGGWVAVLVAACVSVHAEQGSNVLTTLNNTGFEKPSITTGAKAGDEPASWFFFSSDSSRKVGITDMRKREGMQSLLFKAQTPAEAYEGFAQRFSVVPNSCYTFSVWVLNDPQDPVTSAGYGQISIEWKDAAEVELSRTYSPSWGADLVPNRWQRFSVEDCAPSNAVQGIAVITFFGRDSQGLGGFFVDECELVRR